MLKNIVCYLIVSTLLVPGLSFAADNGTTGGTVLKNIASPRYESLAQSSVALNDDVYSIYYNPAGLSQMLRPQVASSFNSGIVDDPLGILAVGMPMGEDLTLGLGLLYKTYGDFEWTDITGTESKMLNAQTDILLTVSGSYYLLYNLALGANLKYLQTTLAEEDQGQAIATDIGALFNPGKNVLEGRLRLGAVIQNLGTPIGFGGDGDMLPLTFRIGGLFDIFKSRGTTRRGLERSPHDLCIAVEANLGMDTDIRLNLGAEYWFQKMLAVRLGYKINQELKGLTAGAGFQYEIVKGQPLNIDYAFSLVQKFNSTHKVALSYGFGKDEKRITDEQREARYLKMKKKVSVEKKEVAKIEKEKKKIESFPIATAEILEIQNKSGLPDTLILNIGTAKERRLHRGLIGYIYNVAGGNKLNVGKVVIREVYASRTIAKIKNKSGSITTKSVVEIKR